jgi:inner membrane protein
LHRGITHSLFFAPLAGPVLGWLAWAWERRLRADVSDDRAARRRTWIAVATLALLSHPLLDYLTPYGTQLLLPFSDARFAINAMPIIDPVYTLLLAMGLLLARWPRRLAATGVAMATLAVSSAYLGYGAWLNQQAEREASRQLHQAGVEPSRIAAFPTLLQVHYRRIVARTQDADLVGFLSMWHPCAIQWSRQSRDYPAAPAVQAFLATREGRIFDWFSMGWGRYRVDGAAGAARVVATDLRYGFTDDPNRSIFTASAPLDTAGRLDGPVQAGRDTAAVCEARFATLFRDTYRADCPRPADLLRSNELARSVPDSCEGPEPCQRRRHQAE